MQRLLGYAGKRGILTYFSWILSAASALLALVPFYFIWRILKEVIEVSPDFGKAVNVTRYGWLAVIFAAAAILVYIGGLMCSHLSAFRIATNLRIDLTNTLPRFLSVQQRASEQASCAELSRKPPAPRKHISHISSPTNTKRWRLFWAFSRCCLYLIGGSDC